MQCFQSIVVEHNAIGEIFKEFFLVFFGGPEEEAGRGVLTVRVAFAEDQLVVDVLNGRDLLKMDTTGSADPYVKVSRYRAGRKTRWKRMIRQWSHSFYDVKVQLVTGDKPVDEAPTFKTAVQKNTLLPLFDETFTLWVRMNEWDEVKKKNPISKWLAIGVVGASLPLDIKELLWCTRDIKKYI